MRVSILFIFVMLLTLSLITLTSTLYYFEDAEGKMYYDLNYIDLEILDIQIIPIDDNPKDFFDDSDVLLITYEITNNGIDYFVLSDKMFKIRVVESGISDESVLNSNYIIDNYFTVYDAEIETRYDDYPSLELFEDCDYLHDRIFLNDSKIYTICFDVLRKWSNKVLNIDSEKKYFLTMMDNQYSTSCPNCINISLSSEMMNQNKILPLWVKDKARLWYRGLITDSSFLKGIDFLIDENFITISNYDSVDFSTNPTILPNWIKNSAKWWANGLISDDDFSKGIQHLIEKEIIRKIS